MRNQTYPIHLDNPSSSLPPSSAHSVVATYVEVVTNALISNLWAVKDLLWVILRLFVISKTDVSFLGQPGGIEEELKRRQRHDAVFNDAHFVLNSLLQRIPGARQHLFFIMEK